MEEKYNSEGLVINPTTNPKIENITAIIYKITNRYIFIFLINHNTKFFQQAA